MAIDYVPLEAKRKAEVFTTISAHDIEPCIETNDFVENLFGKAQMSVVYGASNCGKTFLLTDLAMHVATGRTWHGREIDAGGVVYVAAEGAFGVRNRVAAYMAANDLSYQRSGIALPFYALPKTINMFDLDSNDVDRLIATVLALGGIKLVVLDTLARVMAGGNENLAQDMGQVVANANRVQVETSAHGCIVHHTGKEASKGSRGSSALQAATDTEIEVKRATEDGMIIATVTKQRELEVVGKFAATLEVINLGLNGRGKPVTSCVVRPAKLAEDKKKRRPPRGANQKIILKAIVTLRRGDRLRPATHLGLPKMCSGLPRQELYEAVQDKIPADARHKKSRFDTAIGSLVADEYLGLESGFIWYIPDG